MQSSLNTFDTKEIIDYENLNIITRPRPPHRRQTGISLIPFRPYVKCLTSVRQPFSFTNGYDKWMVMGKDEIFFTQPNARCIGSLIDDCDVSEVIRWDIEAESTHLPMMCKLWMIVDGAVVERGKPHLVQDTAIQVFSAGRNLRSIELAQQRYNEKLGTTTTTVSNRRRRQSWHDINEYHSVPYYQYTTSVYKGFETPIQCDIDNEQSKSKLEILTDVEEEIMDENKIKSLKQVYLQETIHQLIVPQDRVQISITTQTEPRFIDQSTSIDTQLIEMFNLNLETNEILLSSIVNPYVRVLSSNHFSETISFYRNNIQYKHQGVSTGDDYPHWWLRLPTDLILSNIITKQDEEKEKSRPPPSPRQDQSVQTDVEKSRVSSSSRSSRIPKSSSSTTTSNHYEYIDETDDGNHSKRFLTPSDNSQRFDSGLSDGQHENSSIRDYENINKQLTSSKQSENDYHTFVSSLNQHHQQQQQQTISTPDELNHNQTIYPCYSNVKKRTQIKTSESTSTTLLANLLERYEKTLRERQRAMVIANNELLDIDNVLKRYREKTPNLLVTKSNTVMELYRDISFLSNQSKEDRPSLTISNLIKDKYRVMPEITSEEMIQGYIPSPRIHLTNTLLTSPRQRQTRYITSSKILKRPDYCDLCLTDYNTSSAWIKFNERKIEELQKRIDLMLQIDDNEDVQLLLSTSTINTIKPTVTQRIDDILLRKPRYRSSLVNYPDRILSPRRNQYRLPYRLNQSVPSSPRLLSRNVTRSTTPVSKSVRISTQSVPPQTHLRSSTSRPIVSILRRNSVSTTPQSNKLVESSHVWRSRVDGKLYVLEQFSIPRYYRLYNDASFKEIYNASRVLDTYLDTNRPTMTKDYSSLVKSFALDQNLSSTVMSAA